MKNYKIGWWWRLTEPVRGVSSPAFSLIIHWLFDVPGCRGKMESSDQSARFPAKYTNTCKNTYLQKSITVLMMVLFKKCIQHISMSRRSFLKWPEFLGHPIKLPKQSNLRLWNLRAPWTRFALNVGSFSSIQRRIGLYCNMYSSSGTISGGK